MDQTLKNLRKFNILRKEKADLLQATLDSAYASLVKLHIPEHPLGVKFTCGPQSFIAECSAILVAQYKWLGRAERGLLRQTPALALIIEEDEER